LFTTNLSQLVCLASIVELRVFWQPSSIYNVPNVDNTDVFESNKHLFLLLLLLQQRSSHSLQITMLISFADNTNIIPYNTDLIGDKAATERSPR